MNPVVQVLTDTYGRWEKVGANLGNLAEQDPQFRDARWPDWDRQYADLTRELMETCEAVAETTGLPVGDLWAQVLGTPT